METSDFTYKREVDESMQELRGTSAPEESLDRLHRLGIWSRGRILPRGTLFRPAHNRLPNQAEIELILFWLKDAANEIRRKAALVVGQWGGEECIVPLKEVFLDEATDSLTRLYCISGLRNIGGPAAVEVIALALKLGDSDVQDAAVSAIVDLATGGSTSDTDSVTDLGILADDDTALPWRLGEELLSSLDALAKQESAAPAIRFRAADALTVLTKVPVFALPVLPFPAAVRAQTKADLYGGGEPIEPASRARRWISAPLIREDGPKENVEIEILPLANPGNFRPLIEGLFYLSVNNRVVVTLHVPRESLPAGIAALRVSVAIDGEPPVGSHDSSATLKPDDECVFEFAIPGNLIERWCREPKFLLSSVDTQVLSGGYDTVDRELKSRCGLVLKWPNNLWVTMTNARRDF